MPILKPEACNGCPLQALSSYITPDAMVPGSEVLILAQAPGEHEENGKLIKGYEWSYGQKAEILETVKPQPLIGASGQWLQREFWPLTKLDYASVSKANVIKCRPNNKNDLPSIASNKAVNGISVKMLKTAIDHCTKAYLRIPKTTKYILAMGGISLFSLTRETSITSWRGWVIGKDLETNTLQGINNYYTPMAGSSLYTQQVDIFSILHIASLFQSTKFYHATLLDFVRFGNLVRGTWPKALPEIKRYIPTTIPNYIGFDTEFDRDNVLEMWSMADTAGNVYVINAEDTPYSIKDQLKVQTVITQAGLVDIPHLAGFMDVSSIILEDTMLAHSVLWPGEGNSLDYLTSKYGFYNRHKHLRTTEDRDTKYLYAGLDADTTLNHVWKGLLKEFANDKLSWNEYKLRRQPLLHIINRFYSKGIKVYKERVGIIAGLLDTEMASISQRVKELTGNSEFNIASASQVSSGINEGVYSREKEVVNSKPQPRQRKKASDKGTKTSIRVKADLIIAQLKLEIGVD